MAKIQYKQKRRIHLDNITFQFLKCISGKSAVEVARKTGLHQNTIYMLRRTDGKGTRYPSVPTMLKVFRAYGWEFSFGPKNSNSKTEHDKNVLFMN